MRRQRLIFYYSSTQSNDIPDGWRVAMLVPLIITPGTTETTRCAVAVVLEEVDSVESNPYRGQVP